MAESARARANRYARGEFTNTELKILLGGMLADQAIDIATFGRLSALKGRALQAAYRTVSPLMAPSLTAAARGAATTSLRLGGTAARVAGTVAMRHPYIAAGTVLYIAVTNREAISNMIREGWEVVEGVEMGMPTQTNLRAIDPIGTAKRVKRKTSKFNKAISVGMKAIKRSKFLGKSGKFTSSKKAFGTVTRTVSKLRKGKKVSSKGALGTIKRAVKRYI